MGEPRPEFRRPIGIPRAGAYFFVVCSIPGLPLLLLALSDGQRVAIDSEEDEALYGPLAFVCPMGPDIRSEAPTVCFRCRMTLMLELPAPSKHRGLLQTELQSVDPVTPVRIRFEVLQPGSSERQTEFETVTGS